MSTPKLPPINSDRPVQASSTGQPQTPIYDSPPTNYEQPTTTNDQSRITNSAQPVQASFTGQEPTTTNDQTRITNNVQPEQASFPGLCLTGKLGGAGALLLQGMLNEGNLSGLYVGILRESESFRGLVARFGPSETYN